MAEEKMVNGINIKKLADTIHAVRENPDTGMCQFRVRNRWGGGSHVASTIQDFSLGGEDVTSRPHPFVFHGGEPVELLGRNEGPNATEAMLHALATCVGTTLIYHSAAHGVNIEELEVDVEGDLDLRGFLGISDDIRRGFNQIRITFKVKADAPEEKIKEVCRMGQKYSPVFDITTNPTPVSAKVEIKGTPVEDDVSFKKAA